MQMVKKQEAPKQLPMGSQTMPAYRPSDVLQGIPEPRFNPLRKPTPLGLHATSSVKNLTYTPDLKYKDSDLEYDPFYTNAQRYYQAQKFTLDRQNQIYNKHLNDFAGPAAKQRELEAQEER